MSRQKTLSGKHSLHPTTGVAPGYAINVFVQRAPEPATGRAEARAIASQSPHVQCVKVAPNIHARTTGLLL